MNPKQSSLMLVLMLLAGFVGGAVSSWVFNSLTREKIITKRVQIVDDKGNVRISLGGTVEGWSDDDIGRQSGFIHGEGIYLFRADGTLFSRLSAESEALEFHERENILRYLRITPESMTIWDGKIGPRLYLGNFSNKFTEWSKQFELKDPFSILILNEEREVLWKTP